MFVLDHAISLICFNYLFSSMPPHRYSFYLDVSVVSAFAPFIAILYYLVPGLVIS